MTATEVLAVMHQTTILNVVNSRFMAWEPIEINRKLTAYLMQYQQEILQSAQER